MRINEHAWRKARAAIGQRLLLGAVVAFSLTLVAFEWRNMEVVEKRSEHELPMEVTWLEPQLLVNIEKPAPKPPTPVSKPAVPDPIGPVQPSTEPTTDPAPGAGVPGDDPIVPTDPSSTAVDPGAMPPAFVPGLSVKPYFEQCLIDDPDGVDRCTEERILDHLQRKFRMPRSVHGKVRTTVTFGVEVDGTISRVVCAPKVDPEVAREVERVLRSMPRFVPGSQGGMAVPVYYQIPLSLTMG